MQLIGFFLSNTINHPISICDENGSRTSILLLMFSPIPNLIFNLVKLVLGNTENADAVVITTKHKSWNLTIIHGLLGEI